MLKDSKKESTPYHHKISILTPSIRPSGLAPVQASLAKQTFGSYEWLVEMGIPERGCDLSASLNRMLRRARGELIVMWQDWIKAPPEALQNFWDLYQKYPNTFITCPVGKTDDWENIRWDWRKAGEIREIKPIEWEADFACVPLLALRDIGGYDERFDEGWSWENVNLAQRAHVAGYKFIVAQGNTSMAFNHDKTETHPFRGKKENGDLANNIFRNEISQNNWRLDYLS